jgi:hypothetical protein
MHRASGRAIRVRTTFHASSSTTLPTTFRRVLGPMNRAAFKAICRLTTHHTQAHRSALSDCELTHRASFHASRHFGQMVTALPKSLALPSWIICIMSCEMDDAGFHSGQ